MDCLFGSGFGWLVIGLLCICLFALKSVSLVLVGLVMGGFAFDWFGIG